MNLPFITWAVFAAYRQNLHRHRKLVKFVWPVLFYVAVTGPVIYLLLYQVYPSDPESVFRKGQAFHRGGEEVRALALYRALSEAGHVRAGCFQAVVEDRHEEGPSAVGVLRDAVKANPDESDCPALLGRALVYDGEEASARALLQKARDLDPENLLARTSLAFAYFRSRSYEKAAEEFEASLRIDPSVAMNAYNAGLSYFLFSKSLAGLRW